MKTIGFLLSAMLGMAFIFPIAATSIKFNDVVHTLADSTLLAFIGHVIHKFVPNLPTLAMMIFFYWKLTDDTLWARNFALILLWQITLKLEGYADLEDFFNGFYNLKNYSFFSGLKWNLLIYLGVIVCIIRNYKKLMSFI